MVLDHLDQGARVVGQVHQRRALRRAGVGGGARGQLGGARRLRRLDLLGEELAYRQGPVHREAVPAGTGGPDVEDGVEVDAERGGGSGILALLAGGRHRQPRAARETGLTVDGVNHHVRRLSARWNTANRTELVARAYALGVFAAGVRPPRPAASEEPEQAVPAPSGAPKRARVCHTIFRSCSS